jgi:hypothetical protein
MERTQLINIAKIATNIFLTIAIALLLWQFFTADKLVKDIAQIGRASCRERVLR